MLLSVDDSEDELLLSPIRRSSSNPAANVSIAGPGGPPSFEAPTTMPPDISTAMQAADAHHDLFDISSTFGRGTAGMTTYGNQKRRKTDACASTSAKPEGSKSQRSVTSSGMTQRAREDVLMTDINTGSTGDTVRIATGEREVMLANACNPELQVVGQHLSGGTDPAGTERSLSNSSSVPWSADPLDTPSTESGSRPLQPRSDTTDTPAPATTTSGLPTEGLSTPKPREYAKRTISSSSTGPCRKDTDAARATPTQRSDGLTSDDANAIGLPKEQYQPRPSRSRSAQVLDAPMDWSVAPEKAHKKKRRAESALEAGPPKAKRLKDSSQSSVQGGGPIQEELLARGKQARDEDSSGKGTASTAHKTPQLESTEQPHAEQPAHAVLSRDPNMESTSDVQDTIDVTTNKDSAVLTASQEAPQEAPKEAPQAIPVSEPPATNISPISTPSEPAFAMPGLPASASTTSSKKKAKSRRSHTTIFEDHVGLTEAPDASPNLRQQQAQRKRGRPRKSQPVEPAPIEEEAHPAEKAPKKRGRPRKTPLPEPEAPVPDEEPHHDESDQNTHQDVVEEESLFVETETPVREVPKKATGKSGTRESQRPSTPEPSPEGASTRDVGVGKENDAAAQTAPKPVHSPIKKTGTSFRVGLSKRQRIRPLLTVLRKA